MESKNSESPIFRIKFLTLIYFHHFIGQVIKAWDRGIATMKKDEVAVFTCKPEYAYGKQGSPPTIPADATLVFEVSLIPILKCLF